MPLKPVKMFKKSVTIKTNDSCTATVTKDATQTCATVTCEGQVGPATGSATGTVCWPTAPGWAGTTITLNGGGGVLF